MIKINHNVVFANARPHHERRAFSLLELTAVIAIVGLISGMAIIRFGHDTIAVVDGEGFVSRLSKSLQVARRISIAEGSGGTLQFNRDSGNVASFQILRDTGSGDVEVDSIVSVPNDVTVTTPADRWNYDYSGALVTPASGGTITVNAPGWTWTLQSFATTGHCRVTRTANP